MSKTILTEDNFDEIYHPIQNKIDRNASFNGTMFETYGKELDYVLSFANDLKRSQRVWTIVECDEGMFIVAGYHVVNRIGYMITEKEWDDESISIKLEDVEGVMAYEVSLTSYPFFEEWYDLIRYEFDLPDQSVIFNKNGGVKDAYMKYFNPDITYTINHENLRIHDKETAEIFLMEDSDYPDELIDTLLALVATYPIFELKGDGDGLGVIFDAWEDLDSYNHDEPCKTVAFMFDDFE